MMRIIVVACFVCTSLAVPVPINEAKETFINVIGDDGEWHEVNMDGSVDVGLLNNIRWDPGNRYLLFTRKNPTVSQLLIADNVESITSSNYNPRDPTVVVAHGYLGNANTNLNVVIRDVLFKKGDFNVIVLDWSRIAMGSYLAAIAGIPNVGQTLGRFLAFVSRTTGAPLQAMHLVGFSLGSHVVGNAGRELGGRVGRVTGLDPFSPIWQFNSNRLSRTDGIYVEVIHTNGAGDGVTSSMGDADFYPNGGNSQPGCITSICNHNRSWELFAATVEHNHLVGTECSSSNEVAANSCRGRPFNMGNADLNKSGNGLYRLNTLARYPY